MEDIKQIIESGIYGNFKAMSYLRFSYRDDSYLDKFIDEYGEDTYKAIRRFKGNTNNKRKRMMKKTKVMLCDDLPLIFGTLTFRNDVLLKTTKETRRRYVARFLKANSMHYVANIDYGKKKGREHYHFLATFEDVKKLWKYGYYKFEFVYADEEDLLKCNKYILKPINHALKETTKKERLIYSRNTDVV